VVEVLVKQVKMEVLLVKVKEETEFLFLETLGLEVEVLDITIMEVDWQTLQQEELEGEVMVDLTQLEEEQV
jgi:hypothetical protein